MKPIVSKAPQKLSLKFTCYVSMNGPGLQGATVEVIYSLVNDLVCVIFPAV